MAQHTKWLHRKHPWVLSALACMEHCGLKAHIRQAAPYRNFRSCMTPPARLKPPCDDSNQQ